MEKELVDRIEKLESEILKYKKTTIVALVFSIICGSGGLVGLATWISSMPKESKETNKIQVETEKIELEIIKDSLEITSKKFHDFELKHRTEIESISRQLELFKSLGSEEKVKSLTVLLIDKERQFQELIATTLVMCRALATQIPNGNRYINSYTNQMENLRNQSQISQRQFERIQ